MALTPGTRLGPYEVTAQIGVGGMGEVYRARDARLGRDVAVKVLPAAFSADPGRLARFEQEARAAAALNHPNILAVYDFGQHAVAGGNQAAPFIVSEFLEGDTLRGRVEDGALPVRRVVEYAVQIARGLAAAHDKGIVHRDLKPENIFVTADGHVKILDFGLAKLTQVEPSPPTLSALPTTPPGTAPGVVLGTVGYMSPEQVRGQQADSRSDIFALGAVLYEMLAGARAFRGDTPMDTMTAILAQDPADVSPERQVPMALMRIVRRCLEKSPAARFKSADDLAFALEGLSSTGEQGVVSPVGRRGVRERSVWLAVTTVVAVSAVALAATLVIRRQPADVPRAYWTTILPPPGVTIADTSGNVPSRRLALSPDGRQLAFTATAGDGRLQLWVRSLESTAARFLEGTEGATYPFWSPDSRRLGFFAEGQGNARLKTVDLSGGLPVTLCELPGPNGSGGVWNQHDEIFFGTISRGALRRVSASGGPCMPAMALDAATGEASHINPALLPDGRHVLFAATSLRFTGALGIHIASLDSGERKQLVPDAVNATYAEGHLLYLRGATLVARPFDLRTLSFSGDPVVLADDVLLGGAAGFPAGALTVSQTGALAYQAGNVTLNSQIAWVDRAGNESGLLGDTQADVSDVELSPDGARAAVSLMDPVRRTRDVWIYDVTRGVRRRATSDPARDEGAVWSPDGAHIVFMSRRKGPVDLYMKSSGSGQPEEALLADGADKATLDWSPDGRTILYSTAGQGTGEDIWALPVSGGRQAGKPIRYLQTQFNEGSAQFSPDGRWVAYVSDESGQPEVFVSSFPDSGEAVQVSTGGGVAPRWRGDGAELFYWSGNRMMAVGVNGRGPVFQVGVTSKLFERPRRVLGATGGRSYDVSADGQRFVINTTFYTSVPITLIVNWPALLKK